MKKTTAVILSTLMVAGIGGAFLPDTASAAGFNPMNMMNPSKWMGGNKNRRYDDDYYDGGPGYGGYPPPGYGGYGGYPGGYGGYPGGYGAPGYGAPGYGYPQAPLQQPAYAAPAGPNGGSESSEQIRALEDRIRQLESQQQPAPPAYGGGYPSAGGGYPAASGGQSQGGMYPPSSSGGGYQLQNPAFRPTN